VNEFDEASKCNFFNKSLPISCQQRLDSSYIVKFSHYTELYVSLTNVTVWYGMVWYGIVEFNIPLECYVGSTKRLPCIQQ